MASQLPTQSLSLAITGMSCAGCVAAVEAALRAVPGVVEASVNFAERTAQVAGAPPAPTLIAAVRAAGSAGHDPDPHAVQLHRLAGADLGGLAQFRRAVHPHRAAGHQLLAGTAGIADARQLQQLVEFDEVAVEVEIDEVHARSGSGQRHARALAVAFRAGAVAIVMAGMVPNWPFGAVDPWVAAAVSIGAVGVTLVVIAIIWAVTNAVSSRRREHK